MLSPSTAGRDTGPKFAACEEHGVAEYWILDPATLAHRCYHRRGEILIEFAEGAERIESQVVPGFFVLREWLDPDGHPALATALARIEQ